jgi:hypothetical protein
MTKGQRCRIIADFWSGDLPDDIGRRYGCRPEYVREVSSRRGFKRLRAETRSGKRQPVLEQRRA